MLELSVGLGYVTRSASGISVYDFSDPIEPVLRATYNTTDRAIAVAVSGSLVMVSDFSALLGLEFDPDTSVNPLAPAGPFALTSHPNPFNPRTDISFELSRAQAIVVEIFDASGRRLRTLASGHFAAGRHRIAFDGLDGRGRALSSGVYFARVAGTAQPGGIDAVKLVLMR
jgi:hypothetical protein